MHSLMKGLSDRFPSMTVLVHAAFAWGIPWTVYKINKALHRYGDPPWKREEED